MNDMVSCRNLIRQINDTFEKEVNSSLRGEDLTLSQLNLLSELDHARNGELPLGSLQESLGIAQSTVTGLVSRLAAKGLVEIRINPDDRRIHIVSLTAKGARDNERREQKLICAEEKLLRNLTDEEKEMLRQLLQKVYEALQ